MADIPTVLVVDDGSALVEIVAGLRSAGYQADGVATFQDATHALEKDPPDVLITELRLGAYNGLHLALRCRMVAPRTKVLIHTAFPDPVLEEEAAGLGVRVLIRPVSRASLLSAMKELAPITAERRTTSRKRIDVEMEAHIGDKTATVIDVSYTGFRVEIRAAEVPHVFEIRLPSAGISTRAEAVWTRRQAADSDVLVCGATVVSASPVSERSWHLLVDSV